MWKLDLDSVRCWAVRLHLRTELGSSSQRIIPHLLPLGASPHYVANAVNVRPSTQLPSSALPLVLLKWHFRKYYANSSPFHRCVRLLLFLTVQWANSQNSLNISAQIVTFGAYEHRKAYHCPHRHLWTVRRPGAVQDESTWCPWLTSKYSNAVSLPYCCQTVDRWTWNECMPGRNRWSVLICKLLMLFTHLRFNIKWTGTDGVSACRKDFLLLFWPFFLDCLSIKCCASWLDN